MPKIEMLGHQADGNRIRPGNDKLRVFKNYPTPTCEKELDQYDYMTTCLRKFIPGRADQFWIMRKLVFKIPELAAMSTAENVTEENAAENVTEKSTAENVAEKSAAKNVAEKSATKNVAEKSATENAKMNVTETKAAENWNKG